MHIASSSVTNARHRIVVFRRVHEVIFVVPDGDRLQFRTDDVAVKVAYGVSF